MMNRTINYRLLVILLATLVLATGLAFAVHAAQMQRHARNLLAEAQQAERDGDLDRALRSLRRYLVFAPNDNATRARCGEIMEQLAVSDHDRWRTVDTYEQVLYREPSRRDVRRRLARLALNLGWISEARAHLELLLSDDPQQGDLEFLLARCQEEDGDYPLAAVSYENAIRDDPRQIDAYIRLAQLYRRHLDQPEKAEPVLDRLVRNNGESATAYLARAMQRLNRGALAEAAGDLERARALAPRNTTILFATADLERRRGHFAEARHCLQQGCEAEPANLDVRLALADLERQCERKREALACLRQGLQVLPDQPDLLLYLGEMLLENEDEAAAERIIERLYHPGYPPGLAHYLDGMRRLHRREWTKAIAILEDVVQSTEASSGLAGRASLNAAHCYEQLGDGERERAALRRSLALDGHSSAPRLALAASLRRAGRIDEALDQYRELVTLPQTPDETWVLFGQLLVQRNRSLPPRKRRWTEVEEVLNRADRLPTLAVRFQVLRAETLLEQDHPRDAQVLLEKAAVTHPDAPEIPIALADLALRGGDPSRALALLEAARKRMSQRPELIEAELKAAIAQPSRQARRTLQTLETHLERLPEEKRLRLLAETAAAYLRIGEPAEGQRLCRLLADRAPHDLASRLTLLDLVLQSGEEALLARLITEVRSLEGEDGMRWRYAEAAGLLARAENGDTQAAEQARTRVAELVRRRPDDPSVALLQASLHERDGDAAAAADAYLRAFRSGERRSGLAEHLLRLLLEQGRLDEADEVVRRFQQQAQPSPALARLGTEAALRQHSHERAVELARLAVSRDANDYQQLIWLGQVLTQAGRASDGEDTLRQAIKQRDDLAETWLALIAHLARLEQAGEAEEVRMEMQQKLPVAQRPLALAIAAETLSEWDKADHQYRQCLTQSPDDVLVLQRAAAFYVRWQRPEQAEPLLRRLLAAEETAPLISRAWARRQLALLLAFSGDAGKQRQASALLADNYHRQSANLLEDRARLLVQGTQPEQRRAALQKLEASARTLPFTAEELFCLVRLYEANIDETAARERMLDLLALERNNPEYLAHHVERLLQQSRNGEVRPWLVRLQTLEPNSPRVQAFTNRLRKAPGNP